MINYNGNLFPADTPVFPVSNRAFRYGDSLFESIRMFDGNIPLLERHWNRLTRGMEVLKIDAPEKFSPSFLLREINKTISENKNKNHRIRVTVFRSGSGLYTPLNNEAEFLIETSPLDDNLFTLNKIGLSVGTAGSVKISPTIFSSFKTGNSLPYILAAIEKQENKWDDILLLNQEDYLACGGSANIFMVKNNIIMTPPLSSGCLMGVMRSSVLELCQKLNMPATENNIRFDDLHEADEVFLTNAVQGIKWVKNMVGVNKTFGNETSKFLCQEINKSLLKKK